MRKGIIIAIGAVTLFAILSINQENPNSNQIFSDVDPGSLDKRTRMDLAMEQEFERTKDPKLGYVPKNRLKKAYDIAEKKRTELNISRVAISGVEWKERGPTNLGGRTRAILIDPNDGTNNTVFAAAVSGGLWKTTNITVENPNWTSVDDFLENMAITTIAYDPSNTTTMYIGSGEGFFNVDAIQGNGIWKSTDNGDSWTQLSKTITSNFSTCAGDGDCNFLYVNKIVVTSSGTVLAATRSRYTNRGGIMRSTDGGDNWSKVLTGLSGTNSCTTNSYRQWASDIEIGADGDIYASFGIFDNNAIYKSTDDGATWGSAIYTSACTEQRIELATAPGDSEYIYALVQEDDATINKIMRSTDGGTNWNTLTNPTWFDQDCGTSSDDFTRGQAWYDLAIAVDPNDEDVVYIGGVDLFKTTDGGTNWTQLTNWAGNCDYAEVHADQHTIVYQGGSSDVIYFGNDGGIYVTENGSDTSPTFTRKESGYVTAQFYSVAMNPTSKSPNFIGGTQDNGSNKITELGVASIVEVTGGDGGFAHIDQDDSDYQFTAFTNASISRSTDGGLTFTTLLSNSNGQFINPSDFHNTDNDFYAGFSAGTYLISSDIEDASPGFFTPGTITAFNGGSVLHVSASQNTSQRVFFGLDNGQVVRVDNASTSPSATDISAVGFPSSGSVSCVAIEDGDDDHLLVTFSNYGVVSVWETTDGGTNWTDVEGDLPDMPVRWALFNPNNSDQALIATELGVWSTDDLNGSSTEWEPSNTGLANVRTDMLQIRSSDNLVVAASHGRGLFISDAFTVVDADFVADKNTVYAEASVTFTDASYQATSWSWDFGDGGTSTDENPSHTFKRSGKYEVSLTINSGADTETKTDYIHVLPNVATPFSTSDGGNFESNQDYFGSDDITGGINLWELGTPSAPLNTVNSGTNAWKTSLSSDITQADYTCALYSPNFNFSSSGSYTLSFRKSMESAFTNAPIGVNVQYSLDNGENWTRLGTDDGSGINWYDKGPNSSDNLETSVIFDRYGFNADHDNENTSYDVSSLAGSSTVAFRIVLHVDAGFSSGYNVDGFMVDDFVISGTTNEANVNITENSAGSTLSLDGTDDYASLSNLVINESFTAELWIDPSNTNDGQTFLAKHDGSGNDIFKIGYDNNGVEVDIRGTTTVGGSKTTGVQHIAVSVEKLTSTTSQITVYRDGEELYQNTINEVIGDSDGLDWVVGQDWDGVAESDHFAGTIDELRIWNVVRTESEIRANIFLVVDGLDTDLIGYWQFNENTGSSTQNTITSNEGLLSSASWTTSTAPVGKGSSYNATISADGNTSYGSMLDIDFSGVSGTFDVYVFEVDNSPIGTQPENEYTLTEVVKDPFFIINTYGSGTFTDASVTLTYGVGAFTESDASNVYLIKRDSKSNGSWPTTIAATSVNTGTGEAIFDNVTSFSQTLLGAGDVTTPVVWGTFTGKRSNNVNRLEWQTLAEIDNERFEVLRSGDSKIWEKIANVYSNAQSGNSAITLSYSYEDEEFVGSDIAYYQIRQVDFDGQSELSSVVTIDQIIESDRQINIFPNPATVDINLDVFGTQKEIINYSIIDINGRIIQSDQIKVSPGGNEIKLNVMSWNRGIYFIHFSNLSFEYTRRILIN